MPIVFEEEHFNNAFFLLKKTIEFLNTEYKMHFVVFSAYQSKKHNSVVAYTSPGPAGKFFDDNSIGNDLLTKWESFCKYHCFSDASGDECFSQPSFNAFLHSEKTVPDTTNDYETPQPRNLKKGEHFAVNSLKSVDNKRCAGGVKRKSLKDVSDSLVKKAAASNGLLQDYSKSIDIVAQMCESNDISDEYVNESSYVIAEDNSLQSLYSSITEKPPEVPATECELSPKTVDSDSDELSNGSPPTTTTNKTNILMDASKLAYPCHICGKEFTTQSTMKRHLNHVHLKLQSFTCNLCDHVFYRKDKLVSHKKSRHGVTTPRSARAQFINNILDSKYNVLDANVSNNSSNESNDGSLRLNRSIQPAIKPGYPISTSNDSTSNGELSQQILCVTLPNIKDEHSKLNSLTFVPVISSTNSTQYGANVINS